MTGRIEGAQVTRDEELLRTAWRRLGRSAQEEILALVAMKLSPTPSAAIGLSREQLSEQLAMSLQSAIMAAENSSENASSDPRPGAEQIADTEKRSERQSEQSPDQ